MLSAAVGFSPMGQFGQEQTEVPCGQLCAKSSWRSQGEDFPACMPCHCLQNTPSLPLRDELPKGPGFLVKPCLPPLRGL